MTIEEVALELQRRYEEYCKSSRRRLRLKDQDAINATYGKVCSLEGCTEPITWYKGPQSRVRCDTHFFALKENGGLAKRNKKYTAFKKGFTCQLCNYTITQDPVVWNNHARAVLDPRDTKVTYENLTGERLHRIFSSTIISDHIVPHGGPDKGAAWLEEEKNILNICTSCSNRRTYANDDHLVSRRRRLA